ncbi:MAG: RNA polymerase sigma-70 factor [Muribaculaceae bacterium]
MMLSGDMELIEQLFRQYYKALRAYAFRVVNDSDVAEDIVQDLFVSLCDKRDLLDVERNLKSYLFKSVYNRSLNYLSSKKYTEEDSLEQIVDQINVRWVQETNQHDLFLLKELQERIQQFSAKLPPQEQRVFVLSRTNGLRIPEIADEMNLSHKTVEKYLTQALSKLRRYLKDGGLLSVLILAYLYLKFF